MRFGQKRWAVFISGTGSNLSAVLDRRDFVDIGLVVSSNRAAFGILRARRQGVPVHILGNPIDWEELQKVLKEYSVDFIFLLGFMKVVPEAFLSSWINRIFNVHPSLLPKYPGLKSIERAHSDKSPQGVTVHQVVREVDGGQVVLQKNVGLFSIFERAETMVHLTEHQLVRRAVEVIR